MKYDEALAKLEELVEKIENPDCDLSTISDEVKKATEILKFCREYIRTGEAEVEKILKNE